MNRNIVPGRFGICAGPIWNLMLFAFRFNHESRRARQIVLTEELEEILSRRKADRHPGCDRYSIMTGIPWIDYRKCWRSAGVTLGFGAYYCRDCRTITPTFDGDTWCPVDRCT